MTEAEVFAALSDRDVLALTLYGEARGQDIQGRVAVGCVIRNRVRTKYHGTDYRGVCLAPLQFSCFNDGDPNRAVLLGAAQKLRSHELPLPVLAECLWIADGILADVVLDPTKRSRHYHTRAVHPAWSRGLEPVYVCGDHLFFNNVL